MARKLINLRQHRLKQLADADKKRKYGNNENKQEVGKVEGLKTNPFKKIKKDRIKQQMKEEGREDFKERHGLKTTGPSGTPGLNFKPGKTDGNTTWYEQNGTSANRRNAHNQTPRHVIEKPLLKNGATYKESTSEKSGSKEAKIGAGIYSRKG